MFNKNERQMKALKITGVILITLISLALIGMKSTGISPITFGFHDYIQNEDDLAISGYDPVAYFSSQKPIKGNKRISYVFKDVKWLFSSQRNLIEFKSNPAKYTPVAGGHCVFAVSKGFSAPGNPEFWDIKNDKLVFYSDQSVKEECQPNLDDIIKTSTQNWQ